ncbi:MAG: insulinase family protein [Clostridia bacterium]|nr:insulinase family protein [Clostridia bacterium]
MSAIQTDKFKTETLSVSIVMPTDKKASPISLLALSILKRGNESYKTQGEINLRLDELYATSISVKSQRLGNANILGFSAEMLCEEYTDGKTDIFGGTLEVLTQMLYHPLTDENGNFLRSYIESEKNNQCDSIKAQINNPRSYASKRCREIMFEGDAYGISLLGTVDSVSQITERALFESYQHLLSDYRYEFFYIGPRTIEEVAKRLSEAFPFDGRRESVCEVAQSVPKKKADRVRRVTEEMPLAQGKLVLGFTTETNIKSEDFCTMLVLNEIYGASPVSKLFMNVRERLSLCYYCSSFYDIFKGALFVSCGVSPENRDKAEREILSQLSEIVKGNISDEEFEAAKRSLYNNYRSLSDSPAHLEGYYFCRNEFGVDCTIEQCMSGIRAVKISDVVRVASNICLDTVYFLNGSGEEGEDADE